VHGCNQGCIERLSFEMKSATCSFNPSAAANIRAAQGRSSQALVCHRCRTGRSVGRYGGGSAGAEGGNIRERGKTGGQLFSASRPPHKAVFMDWVTWSLRQLKKFHTCSLPHMVSKEEIKQHMPDAVILACDPIRSQFRSPVLTPK